MLKTLTVWNFALIEYVQVEFTKGLNILTGETGAGKSILIDSVGVILGYRTSADHIRNGSDWLRVEATFDISTQDFVHKFLDENGILDDAEDIIISRQISKNGKNIIRVNGCQITLTLLKELGELLIDIHGQHENQALLRRASQFALLENDEPKIRELLSLYQSEFNIWRDLEEKIRQKEIDSREYERRLDMLKWQAEEIASANLKENEDEELETEIKLLSNAEKIADSAKDAYQVLAYGDKGNGGILARLADVKKNLEIIVRYDEKVNNTLKMVEDSLCQLQECSYDIRDYGEGLEYSPEKLNALQARMDIIYKLRKKYGATIEDVLSHYDQVKEELEEIENYDEIIAALRKKLQMIENNLHDLAKNLTNLRSITASKLSMMIEKHLVELGMPNAKFDIKLSKLNKLNSNGGDDIQMLFSANLGEDQKDVQKVASGGELSRIALAIKAVSAERDEVGVMVFDEIDTGIGGKTAQMVAERIAMVAVHKQVLCITHLPQIACMADTHLYIDKKVQNNKTVTSIKRLSTSEQINELARMFSGMDVTSASLDNALEMLNNAKLKKEKLQKK